MKTSCRLLISALLFFFLTVSLPYAVFAGEPSNQVKQTVDAVIEVLKDKELKKPAKTAERRSKIRRIVGERFDFEEMSRRSLGQHWKKRTAEEQKEFISLYSDLLENTYIKKIERYEDEKIVYGEEKTEGAYSSVRTRIVTGKEVEIPIEYRLLRKDGKWEVYDVVIEGVSLVNNYRNQFNSIIRSHSYEELVKRMKNKALKEPVS